MEGLGSGVGFVWGSEGVEMAGRGGGGEGRLVGLEIL